MAQPADVLALMEKANAPEAGKAQRLLDQAQEIEEKAKLVDYSRLARVRAGIARART